ncbi:hypothetical protein HYQ46_004108 [Verticillium longisporum]|nr:hypothetical protein HYQ46_004108 [Verticillium longisporum]
MGMIKNLDSTSDCHQDGQVGQDGECHGVPRRTHVEKVLIDLETPSPNNLALLGLCGIINQGGYSPNELGNGRKTRRLL